MSQTGPIGESVLRARKSLASHLAISEAISVAFLEESDEALPRTVIAALSRIVDGLPKSAKPNEPGSEHWVGYRLFLDPVILSAATLRAARIINGSSGTGTSIGMPRRANDFPDVTPFGLGLFYRAALLHSRKGGPGFGGLDELFSLSSVDAVMNEHAPCATLTDALLLSLVPSAMGQLSDAAQQGRLSLSAEASELSSLSEVFSGLRVGRLPEILPKPTGSRDLFSCESFHGLLQAAVRLGFASKDKADQWPPLIAAYLPSGAARQPGQGATDVPLVVCALASTWLKVTWRRLTTARKEAFLADFSSLVAGCAHEQAEAMPAELNRTIA